MGKLGLRFRLRFMRHLTEGNARGYLEATLLRFEANGHFYRISKHKKGLTILKRKGKQTTTLPKLDTSKVIVLKNQKKT